MNALALAFLHMLDASIFASILIALLLAIKKPLHSLISARVFHILWLLIFIRLMMPIQVQGPFGISNLIPDKIQMVAIYQENKPLNLELPPVYRFMAGTDEGFSDNKSYDEESAATTSFSLQPFVRALPYIWIIGCIMSILSLIALNSRSRSSRKGSKRVMDPAIMTIVEQCLERLQVKKRIPIYMNSLVKSPCIAGVTHPTIYLPEDIGTQISPDQLQYILLHEIAHYKRGDLICNSFSLLAASIHWFNPLVWLAVKEMRHDREVACDTLVMEVLGESNAISYGMTLIDLSRFTHKPRQTSLASFNAAGGQVERRIKMIKSFKKGSYKISILTIVLCTAIGAVILTGSACNNPSLNNMNSMANLVSNDGIKEKLVVIDPGHGGDDFGAVYPFDQNDANPVQVKEKDLNLEIALKLYEMLNKSGIKVKILRNDDRYLTLDDRINMANADNAALILSIHNGSAKNEATNGTCTFYSAKDMSAPGLTSGRFAEILQNELIKQLQTGNLGIKEVNFRVLKETNAPAALVEPALLSNEPDRKNLMDGKFLDRAAQALYDGVVASLNEMVNTETGTSQNRERVHPITGRVRSS